MGDAISKTVLITGCSTGIGRATAERLVQRGWSVYATARRVDTLADLERQGCKVLPLDVCDDASDGPMARVLMGLRCWLPDSAFDAILRSQYR